MLATRKVHVHTTRRWEALRVANLQWMIEQKGIFWFVKQKFGIREDFSLHVKNSSKILDKINFVLQTHEPDQHSNHTTSSNVIAHSGHSMAKKKCEKYEILTNLYKTTNVICFSNIVFFLVAWLNALRLIFYSYNP